MSPQELNLKTDQQEDEGLDALDDNNNEMDVEINNEDEQNDDVLVDRRYPCRERRPINRNGQTIYD